LAAALLAGMMCAPLANVWAASQVWNNGSGDGLWNTTSPNNWARLNTAAQEKECQHEKGNRNDEP